jgi:hypothetical protein
LDNILQKEQQAQWREIFQFAVVEITGEKMASKLLADSVASQNSLLEFHSRCAAWAGMKPSRGLEIRIGQAAFRIFLRRMALKAGFFLPEVKILPARRKIPFCFKLLADQAENAFNLKINYLETGFSYQLTFLGSLPVLHALKEVSFLVVGFLKEYLSWVDGGKAYSVIQADVLHDENQSCVFQIQKTALDG